MGKRQPPLKAPRRGSSPLPPCPPPPSETPTGAPSMRLPACRLALVVFVCSIAPTLADEPAKPTATASEKNPAVPAAGHSVHGEAFDEGPRQKAYLKEGQGKVDFQVTTSKPEAQAFINQGVAQLHSFYY